jgi:TIR domain
MAHEVFISHSSLDKPVADAVCAALENIGIRCWIAPRDVQPELSFAGEITRAIEHSKVMVLIFSAHSNISEQILREVQLAANSHLHIVQFRIEDVVPNDVLEYYLSTPHWLDALTPPLEANLQRLGTSVKALLEMAPEQPVEGMMPVSPTPTVGLPHTVEKASPRSSRPKNLLEILLDAVRKALGIGHATQTDRVKTLVPPEPVLLCISMPRQVEARSSFTARFAAYIESAKISAKEHLKDLGEKDDRIVTDIRPDREARWRIGAPVTIRLTGEHVTIAQSERSFEWNGRENLISFVVSVNSDAPQTIQLCFHVLIGPLEIAFIPVSVAISAGSTDAKSSHIEMRAPSSAFASYSSKDAQPVTQSLSTLAHWAPTLNIFQDCLDLRPNEAFKEQIKKEIATRDVFLLFWSRNASASKWVLWELETARAKPGLNAILPMPLEDPAIVPPPSGFEDKHLRDRFLLAGYGLKKIAEIASKKGPGSF